MTYKGYRIDRKCNVFDLNDNLIKEKAGNVMLAQEFVDQHLEEQHKARQKNSKKEDSSVAAPHKDSRTAAPLGEDSRTAAPLKGGIQ